MRKSVVFNLVLLLALIYSPAAGAEELQNWRKPHGGVTLTVLDTGRIPMPDSYAWKGGEKIKRDWPILAFLIHHPKGKLLVDAGCNPAFATGKEREYAGWIYPIAKLIFDFPKMKPGQDVGSQLDKLGIDRGSLRAVILTHTHVDHAGGIGTIPADVPVYHGEGEMAEFETFNADLNGFHRKDIEHGNKFTTVPWRTTSLFGFRQTWDFFDDGSVILIEAPGHTPGSLMVLVNLESQPFLITGDAVYTHHNYEIPAPKGKIFGHRTDWDETWAMETIERVRGIHQKHPEVFLLLSHDVDQFPTLKIAPDAYH